MRLFAFGGAYWGGVAYILVHSPHYALLPKGTLQGDCCQGGGGVHYIVSYATPRQPPPSMTPGPRRLTLAGPQPYKPINPKCCAALHGSKNKTKSLN